MYSDQELTNLLPKTTAQEQSLRNDAKYLLSSDMVLLKYHDMWNDLLHQTKPLTPNQAKVLLRRVLDCKYRTPATMYSEQI